MIKLQLGVRACVYECVHYNVNAFVLSYFIAVCTRTYVQTNKGNNKHKLQ